MNPDLKGFPLNQDIARLVGVNWTQPHSGGNPNLSFHHLRAPQVNRDVHLTITIPLYLILQITRFERCAFFDLFVNNCLVKGDSTFTSSPSLTTGPPGVLGTPPFPRKRDFISLPFIIPAHQAVPGLGTSETGGALKEAVRTFNTDGLNRPDRPPCWCRLISPATGSSQICTQARRPNQMVRLYSSQGKSLYSSSRAKTTTQVMNCD